MPSQPENLYEYAVIRLVPKVEREEFINIGLIMLCKRRRWVRAAYTLPEAKIRAIGCDIPREELQRQLDSFVATAHGTPGAGEIAALVAEERFRWLTAVRSACIQTSRPHPGLADDLDATFDRLWGELV